MNQNAAKKTETSRQLIEVDNDIEAVNHLYRERRWGDGLPVIPPTRERVERMLGGTTRPADEVVAHVQPGFGAATVRLIAVNAVMAGCNPGCMPVLIAWSAVTGSLTWTPVVLFLIVFFWTPPHYWPLAMKYKDDYQRAGVPMLPVLKSAEFVCVSIVRYSWVMVAVSLLLIPVAPMGPVYSASAVLLGGVFLFQAYRLLGAARSKEDEINIIAMRLFHYSISYLALLFLAVAIDPFVF